LYHTEVPNRLYSTRAKALAGQSLESIANPVMKTATAITVISDGPLVDGTGGTPVPDAAVVIPRSTAGGRSQGFAAKHTGSWLLPFARATSAPFRALKRLLARRD
jgi:hypothetical protein